MNDKLVKVIVKFSVQSHFLTTFPGNDTFIFPFPGNSATLTIEHIESQNHNLIDKSKTT